MTDFKHREDLVKFSRTLCARPAKAAGKTVRSISLDTDTALIAFTDGTILPLISSDGSIYVDTKVYDGHLLEKAGVLPKGTTARLEERIENELREKHSTYRKEQYTALAKEFGKLPDECYVQ